MSTIGTKGQIVIPQKSREKHKLKEGNKMVFFEGLAGKNLVLLKANNIATLLREMKKALKKCQAKKTFLNNVKIC